MERSGNFYKAIRLGYILISILIGCMAYNSLYEWQEIEALELGNKKIDELRKEINNINIQMIKFSLLGETILEWNDKDIEHYHARRMAMDSMLCRFKATYPAERIDSVRSLLEDKERQMFQIVRLMDEQQSINKKIANQIPVIVQKSVQEQSKKPKRKGFLGIFGKKKEVTPAVSTTILHSLAQDAAANRPVEAREHVRRFHELFFTLAPDKDAIESNMRRAFMLTDKTSYDYYKDLAEKGYYNRIISGNIHQRIEIDSISCNFDSHPYKVVTFAKQYIVRSSNTTIRSLVTECNLVNSIRSDNNPQGFTIEKFVVLENRDLQTINK